MKWIKRLVIVFVLFLVLLVGGIYLALDGIVKTVVENQGTEQLKVPTTLSSVSLGIFNGTVDLNTFALGSPAGFTAPQMFSVSKLAVDTGGLGHLRSEPIHISTISIDNPNMVIEEAGGKINFKELINGLPSSPDTGPSTTTSSGKPAVKLVINTLTITNAHVQLQGSLPGISKSFDIALPTMTMQNIGNADGNNNGVAIKDVVVAVITKMVAETTHSKDVPAEVQVLLTGNLGQIQDKVTGAVQGELGKLKIPAALNGTAGDAAKGAINQGFNILNGGKKQ